MGAESSTVPLKMSNVVGSPSSVEVNNDVKVLRQAKGQTRIHRSMTQLNNNGTRSTL